MSSIRQIRQSSVRPHGRSNVSNVSSSRAPSISMSERSVSFSRSASVSLSGAPEVQGIGEETLREGVVELTKNARYCVVRLPATPAILKSSSSPVVDASIDSLSRYGLLVTPESCLVWDYSSPDHVPNTLAFPGSSKIATLVPSAPGSNEPGLVTLGSKTGELTYWEAVGGAVADGLLRHKQKSVSYKVGLYSSEVVEKLENIDPAGIVATTSSGRYILITLRDATGKVNIVSHTMHGGPSGLLSSIRSAIAISGSRRDVVSVKPGPKLSRHERLVLIVTQAGDVTVWECSRSGSSKLLVDSRLGEVLINHISDLYPYASSTFRVHDIEHAGHDDSGIVYVLASFTNNDQGVYYLVYTVKLGSEVSVLSAHRIQSYTGHSSTLPKLRLPEPKNTLFVVLSQSIVLLDAHQKFSSPQGLPTRRWEDVVILRHEVQVLGSGSEDLVAGYSSDHKPQNSSIIAFTQGGAGVLKVERFADFPENAPSTDSQASDLDLAKSKIEQAVFYGSSSEDGWANPLSFGARKELQFDAHTLEQAFLQVSREIVCATSPYLPPLLPSMAEHLSIRVSTLERLAQFLQANYRGMLSVSTRFQLLWDLEKTVVAKALWEHIDGRMQFEEGENVLVYVINQSASSSNGDPLREWFLQRIPEIQNLLVGAGQYCAKQYSAGHRGPETLQDTNMVLLESIYHSALNVRNAYMGPVFELAATDVSKEVPWASTNTMIRVFESQYDMTRRAFNALTKKDDRIMGILGDQLVYLVETLCVMNSQRLKWSANSGEKSTEIWQAYSEARGGWLKQLVDAGYKDSAIRIAEQFQIYRSLVEILLEDWSIARNRGDRAGEHAQVQRLNHYMDVFQYEFAATLYQYLVETKQLKALLTMFPQYTSTYLDKFLSTQRHINISWAHNVRMGDYLSAGKALNDASRSSVEDIATNKKLKLSIAKLSLLASGQKKQQESLLMDIENQIKAVDVENEISKQLSAESYESLFKYVDERNADGLAQVLKRALGRMDNGRALSVEELIDILTLTYVDRTDSRARFYWALQLCASSELPDARRPYNERLIWRRLFLSDNWEDILKTKNKSDSKVKVMTEKTILFTTLSLAVNEQSLVNEQFLEDPLSAAEPEPSESILSARYGYANEELQASILKDTQTEGVLLQTLVDHLDFASWTQGISSRLYTISKDAAEGRKKRALRLSTAPVLSSSVDSDGDQVM